MNLFTLIVAFMPLFSFALIPPAITKARGNKQELTIVYHKANADISIEVLSGDDLVGQACSSSLNSGAFKSMPIIFDVDKRGSGNLTIGSFTYRIHEEASHSGGIICTRMFNHAEAAVSCTVAVPADLPIQPLSKSNIAVCISERHNRLAKLFRVATKPPRGSITGTGQAEMIFDPPPQPHCGSEEKTQRFGDGDPHQNYYLLQLSENMFCGAAKQCTVGYSETKGISITWSVNADFGSKGWISAGFSVAVSWNTGTDYHCSAGPGETVCVWYNTAHTAYTVRKAFKDCRTGKQSFSEPYIISSPNLFNAGGGQYCVVGTCRHEGANYWDRSGPDGGPDI